MITINHETKEVIVNGEVSLFYLLTKLEDLKYQHGYTVKGYNVVFQPAIISGYQTELPAKPGVAYTTFTTVNVKNK